MTDGQFTESALCGTVEQFHILVDSVEEYAIYMLDPSGNVVTWNRGARKIKGYTAEEIIGKNFACFYTAEDVGADKPQGNLREAARRGHIRDQGLRVRKDGSTFEAEVVLTALRDANGSIRGYSKVTRDITDQIRSEHDKTVHELLKVDRDEFAKNPKKLIKEKERQLNDAVKILDFETAAILRDEIRVLQK